MTYYHNTFEGGSDGTTLTIANSGGASGDAFSYIFSDNVAYVNGNSNIVYSAAAKANGNLGLRITLTASTSYVRIDDSNGGTRGVIRVPITPSTVSGDTAYAVIRNVSNTVMASVGVYSDGKIRAYNSTGGRINTSAYTPTLGTLYWAELAATSGADTSTGRIEMKIFAADGTTELYSYDSGTTVNTGTENVAQFRWGTQTTATGLSYVDIDDIQADSNLSTGWLGPYTPGNVAPNVSLSSDVTTIFPGETATLTATATDSDGSITSTGWSATVGTLTGSGLTRTITAPPSLTDQTSTITFSATDNGGATSNATVNITMKASASKVFNGSTWKPLVEYLIT